MADSTSERGQYIVVARRYRPQGFDDLVGQGMVSQALKNAITTDRVGHAYLFTGARGVGKTSTARILSKALNCQKGPTETPCHECDICQTIAAGERIAQMVIAKYEQVNLVEVDVLSETDRGAGGFGSTGTK